MLVVVSALAACAPFKAPPPAESFDKRVLMVVRQEAPPPSAADFLKPAEALLKFILPIP